MEDLIIGAILGAPFTVFFVNIYNASRKKELADEIAKHPGLIKALSDFKAACDKLESDTAAANNIACGHIADVTKQKQI